MFPARVTELEQRIHHLEAQVQSQDRQIGAWKNRFRVDCQEIRRSHARITELEEQLVEVTQDRDGFHGMSIALDEQLVTVTAQRDAAHDADAAHLTELAGVTAQRNHAVETLIEIENQMQELEEMRSRRPCSGEYQGGVFRDWRSSGRRCLQSGWIWTSHTRPFLSGVMMIRKWLRYGSGFLHDSSLQGKVMRDGA